jgi:hypothetical protein
MDEDAQRIVAHAWEARLHEPDVEGEVWFIVPPHDLPTAAALHEQGWLQRRLTDEGSRWRLSDQGLEALRTDTLREAHATPN